MWNEMFEFRINIENSEYGIEYGITDKKEILKMVEEIKLFDKSLIGDWFLANLGTLYVGEIGLVLFCVDGVFIARL